MMGSFSPSGLHVLVVDDDPLCLMVLERMLRQCAYKVTTCTRVRPALNLLRNGKDDFDLVMSDVYMPDEDGFKLLEVIGLELDLPVIMMSANGETSVVMKGIAHGACDYLIKPVRMEELRNIWQHVIRKKGKEVQKAGMQGDEDERLKRPDSQDQSSKKRKELEEIEDCMIDDINNLKKARVNWSVQLHRKFVQAVNQLGVDKAVPKRILEVMNVQGLTRENIASHLQKYRLYMKRLSGVEPEPSPIASFQACNDGTLGGTMMVQPGGRGSILNAGTKDLNLGAGAGITRKLDSGTMQSLVQLNYFQQQQAANRAQILGGLGLSDTRSLGNLPLQRMMSLDLSHFLQSQHIGPSFQKSSDALDDLAACSFLRPVKQEEMSLPFPVRSREELKVNPIADSTIHVEKNTSFVGHDAAFHNAMGVVRNHTEPLVISPGTDNNVETDKIQNRLACQSSYMTSAKGENTSGESMYIKASYAASLVDIIDVSSEDNIGNNNPSIMSSDRVADAYSNHSLGCIISATTHFMENTELDISDYLDSDDGFL